MFSLICAWINCWVNNREAGDLRRHRVHYDVTAMHHEWLLILIAITEYEWIHKIFNVQHCKTGQYVRATFSSCVMAPFMSIYGGIKCSFGQDRQQIQLTRLFRYISVQWRHNWRDGVSDHQPHDCLLNRLFRRRSKKHQSSASLVFVLGIHRWPMNSPHKGPVTRKKFPFDDVIIINSKCSSPDFVFSATCDTGKCRLGKYLAEFHKGRFTTI